MPLFGPADLADVRHLAVAPPTNGLADAPNIRRRRWESHWPGLLHVVVFVAVFDFGGNPAADLARMRMEPPFG